MDLTDLEGLTEEQQELIIKMMLEDLEAHDLL